MPTYDYACRACGHALVIEHSITAPAKKKCPRCGKNQLERRIGAGASFVFKGSGFYSTDYRAKTPPPADVTTPAAAAKDTSATPASRAEAAPASSDGASPRASDAAAPSAQAKPAAEKPAVAPRKPPKAK